MDILAIILAPLIAVWVGQLIHTREEKRNDKLSIFKTLMATRNGWTMESVKALNIIEIVFSDDKNVLISWKDYYDKLCVQNPTPADLKKIEIAQGLLLETIAKSLGYKKVTWETIQNPYLPTGMQQDAEMEREFKRCQLAWVKQQVPQQSPPISQMNQPIKEKIDK